MLVIDMDINKVIKNFMGPKITKEGSNKYWGTDDLDKHCLHAINNMSVEDKFKFLIDQGFIE